MSAERIATLDLPEIVVMDEVKEDHQTTNRPQSCLSLLEQFKASGERPEAKLFEVEGLESGQCVTNITGFAPLRLQGEEVEGCLVRLDEMNSEGNGQIRACALGKDGKTLRFLPGFKIEKAEDPALFFADGQIGVVGTSVSPKADVPNSLTWRSVAWMDGNGNNIDNLKEIARGSEQEKDLRILQLESGKFLVFTRPEIKTGVINTDGKQERIKRVAYFVVDSLRDINSPERLKEAKIIEGMCIDKEWAGVGSAIELENGNIGVLVHKAYEDKPKTGVKGEPVNKHYYMVTGELNCQTGEWSNEKMVASRDNLPFGKVKCVSTNPDQLWDVAFGNDMRVTPDFRWVFIYGGASDAEAVVLRIIYPFSAKPKLTEAFNSLYRYREKAALS